MDTEQKLLTFPCEFPIKIFGHNSEEFEPHVLEIFNRHVEDAHMLEKRKNAGRGEKFLALTIVINAQSQEQLDSIYQLLSSSDKVVMAL